MSVSSTVLLTKDYQSMILHHSSKAKHQKTSPQKRLTGLPQPPAATGEMHRCVGSKASLEAGWRGFTKVILLTNWQDGSDSLILPRKWDLCLWLPMLWSCSECLFKDFLGKELEVFSFVMGLWKTNFPLWCRVWGLGTASLAPVTCHCHGGPGDCAEHQVAAETRTLRTRKKCLPNGGGVTKWVILWRSMLCVCCLFCSDWIL